MVKSLAWTSEPIRTVEVPEPDAQPIGLPEPNVPDQTTVPDLVPARPQ